MVIDRTFPLKDAAAAHRYIESRQAVGRVLLIPEEKPMPRAKNGDVEIEWQSFGDGQPETVLLVNGLGSQMTRWPEAFCEKLVAKGYRAIRLDNRDTGLSTWPAGQATRWPTWPTTPWPCSTRRACARPTSPASPWAG